MTDTELNQRLESAIYEARTDFDRMRGRLLAAIESFGLSDIQTVGCKATIKNLSYDSQANLEAILRGSKVF